MSARIETIVSQSVPRGTMLFLTCVCKGILLLLGFWTVRSSTTLATLSIITCMFESQFIMGRIFSTWQPKYCVETCSDRTECLYV